MVDDGYISFKEMCSRFDVTPRTLRYYEYIELLNPRKSGRSRFYGPRELARMKLILRGRRFGFSLEDIRQWLLIYGQKGTQEQYRVWIDLANRQYDQLAQQKAELEVTMRELRELRDETQKLLETMAPDAAEPTASPEEP
ncbi:MerR family transcriptional regulator [Paracoccus aminophilus]|uniref:Transcriptional regulator, MerR family n=1 Tax=Paracoccus aminophilus JCM 7686 TaxID=1367847 RepID=S5XWF4_PARAH|nr:MerR family DNA-binding transcriptional regulator [Paracoccus aminophilus]AGT07740.1 transcriptional regulator, MerR family [Paracoccus aminophilus JCM 7686]